MLFRQFSLTFFAVAASVNALAIPLHSRRADNLASTTGNNGAPVTENNAANIALPPQSVSPSVIKGVTPAPASPPAAAPNTDSSSQQSRASSPPAEPAVNRIQVTTPFGVVTEKRTMANRQSVKSATDTPTADNTVQTNKSATGTPESSDVQGASPTEDALTAPAANNGQSSSSAANTPEANSVQPTTPNKNAVDTTNGLAAQSTKDSSAINDNNTPSPLATTPDTPSLNGIQPPFRTDSLISKRAQPQSSDMDASESANSQTTPSTGPAAPESDVATTPTPESMTTKQLQPASEPKIASSPQSTEETPGDMSDSQSASVEAPKANSQPAPAVDHDDNVPEKTDTEAKPVPASVDEAKPVPQPAGPKPSIECLTLLMKTQQPLTGACHKLIRDDPTLIQLVGLGSVELDFMYSGKDFPVISSDGLRLKLQEIPGYTLSVVEARYDVTINYKNRDTASFSPPWASSTMQASTVITPIDQVDVKVLSTNTFTGLIAAMLTKPKTPIILMGTVDINLSISSTDGGAPKNIIIAGLQFSSKSQMPGLDGLAKKSFVRSDSYDVYGNTFYFTSVFEFTNPSNLKLTLGGVKFDVLDSAGKQLATAAIDLFEIAPNENEVSLRLISNVDDSAAFLNRLHYTGDTVTIQGKTGSSKNPLLNGAVSQLKFTVTYPAVADVPAQNVPVAVDTPLSAPAAVADIPPESPLATPPGLQ